jgi:hypothetical protein
VRFDDAVQHAAFGVARLIRGAWHARDIRPAHGRGQCRKRDTSKPLGERRERMLQAGRPLSGTPSCSAPVTNLPSESGTAIRAGLHGGVNVVLKATASC